VTLRRRIATAAGLLLLALGAAFVVWLRGPAPASDEELSALRARRDRLRATAEAALSARVPIEQVEEGGGNVVLAVRNGFVDDLLERLVPAYLSRVRLNLEGVEADEQGALRKGTPLGDLKLGSWDLHLVLREAHGVLRAGTPELSFERGQVNVRQPFELLEGQVRGGLAFRWDSSGVTNLVCRDFESVIAVAGRARPRHYSASGVFLVSATDGAITLRPEFGRPSFRLMVEASEGTWEEARAALEREDGLLKCGLAMDPPEVVERLRDVVARGIEVRLPRELFKAVRWPARLGEQIEVQGRPVRFEVRSPDVRITERFLIYAATVDLQRGSEPAPVVPNGSPTGAVEPSAHSRAPAPGGFSARPGSSSSAQQGRRPWEPRSSTPRASASGSGYSPS